MLYVFSCVQNMQEDASPENLLTNFCSLKENFGDGKPWRVATDTDAVMALILLTGSNMRPTTLSIDYNKDWSHLRDKALLSVAAEQCKSVSLKYMSLFWTPVPETTKKLKTALQFF